MPRRVFDEVLVVVSQDRYVHESKDATGKLGDFPVQNLVSAIRQLCYGLSSDGVENRKVSVRLHRTRPQICFAIF